MKLIITLISIIGLALSANAQSARMAFFEIATQASCPPCASFNPPFDELIEDNEGNAIVLKYQVWWPGFDPMYLDNEEDVDDRIGYYSIQAAPSAVLNGSEIGTPNQSGINAVNSETAAFDISITGALAEGSLTLTGTVTGNEAVTGDLKLRLVVTEKLITIDDAPGGTNGETEYAHVMKKFVNGTAGTTLADTWAAGDTYNFEEAINISSINVYNIGQLEVIAFIQDDNTKEVLQAAVDHDLDFTSTFNNNASVAEIDEVSIAVCAGSQSTISPTVAISNLGNNDLTSATIVYSINGGDEQTYAWSGSLSLYQKEDVVLDPISFEALVTNSLDVRIENPNNEADEDSTEDAQSLNFEAGGEYEKDLTLTLNFDCWPEETSWMILNSSGATVAQGGPYGPAEEEAELIESIPVDANDCYSFVLSDLYGDGMHGSQWGAQCSTDGTAELKDSNDDIIYSYDGSYDFSAEESAFYAKEITSVEELSQLNSIDLYPNPVHELLNINFSLQESTTMEIFVSNTLGQVVHTISSRNYTGANKLEVNTANLSNGVYFLTFSSENKRTTKRFTVSK